MSQLFPCRRLSDAVIVKIAVMLQNSLFPEQIAEHFGILFNDACIGNDVDDALQPKPDCLL